MGQSERALDEAQRAAEKFSEDSRMWLRLAKLESRAKHDDAAERAYEKAVEVAPRSPEALASLAAFHTRKNHGKKAAEAYEALLRVTENDVIALNNAAVLYSDELDLPGRAVELAERAIELEPHRAEIQDTLGWALLRRNRPEDLERATVLLTRADRALNSPGASYHHAVALDRAGKTAEARSRLHVALAGEGDFAGRAEAERLLQRL
jgi:Flp pilus assembly protein TadD